jgi:hypothetical protein
MSNPVLCVWLLLRSNMGACRQSFTNRTDEVRRRLNSLVSQHPRGSEIEPKSSSSIIEGKAKGGRRSRVDMLLEYERRMNESGGTAARGGERKLKGGLHNLVLGAQVYICAHTCGYAFDMTPRGRRGHACGTVSK